MKNVWVSVLVAFFILSCSTTKDIRSFNTDEELINYYKEFIPGLMEEYDVKGLSVALVKDGELFWSKGFGYSDKNNGIKATDDTIFAVASISKLFTGIAIMQLVEDGLINLDSPITDYIPEFNIERNYTEEIPITVRNLMTHHSGIPDSKTHNMFGESNETFHGTVAYLNTQKTVYKPREVLAYSNLAINLLGIIVERVSGDNFTDYVAQNILSPLSMDNSSFQYVYEWEGVDKNIVSKSYKSGSQETYKELRIRDIPAAGLFSNAKDLSNFIQMVLGGGTFNNIEIIKKESLAEMLKRQNSDVDLDLETEMGLSFFLSDSDFPGVKGFAGHDGSTYFHHSDLGILTNDNIGVVVLSNTDSGRVIVDHISDRILETTYEYVNGEGFSRTIPVNVKKLKRVKNIDESTLGDYSTYYGLVKVFKDGKKLKAKMFGKNFDLIAYEDGWFSLEYKLLGFIPYKNKFLKNIYFKFKNYSGKETIITFNGNNLFIGGVKIRPVALDPIWEERLGEYELLNPDITSKVILVESNRMLLFKADGYLFWGTSKANASISIPSGKNEMYRPYLSRKGFETLFFRNIDGEEVLENSGYLYKIVD